MKKVGRFIKKALEIYRGRMPKKKVKLTFLLFTFLIFLRPSFGFCDFSPSYIAIYGDSRTGHDIHRQIVKAMLHYKPTIVFHTGDIVYDGPDDWALFNEITSELIENAEFFAAIRCDRKS